MDIKDNKIEEDYELISLKKEADKIGANYNGCGSNKECVKRAIVKKISQNRFPKMK